MKKVLLLNPPGTKKYFRDYYCPCVSKAKYYYHPLDLVYLSGILNQDFEVSVIDSIAQNLNPVQTQQKVIDIKPDYLIFLLSAPSYEEDLKFFNALKNKLPNTEFIGTGDVYREYREKSFILNKFLDTILLDFSTNDILTYLRGQKSGQLINNIIYKNGKKILAGAEIHGSGNFSMPIPRWDLFPLDNYFFPFSRRGKYATILTDFGCPFNCRFCPMNTIGFKLRDIKTVLTEIKYLKSQGIKELFIRDQTFGVNKDRTYKLCHRFIKEKLNLSWTCFSRVDVVDAKLLQIMKKAGCHTIMYGIESANEEILKSYQKNIAIKQMIKALKLSKKYKIRTVGTFIIGLPGESKKSIENTIKFACQIPLDYASFNVATPRFGTKLRQDLLKKGILNKKNINTESRSVRLHQGKDELSDEEIFALQDKAIKKFYLRPDYIIGRLLDIKTWYEFQNQVQEGLSLIFRKN